MASFFRPRCGLFSQPVSTAIGETNKFIAKKAEKDEDGKVIIGPRNFYTTKMKTGMNDNYNNNVFFGKQSYISVGDPYQ